MILAGINKNQVMETNNNSAYPPIKPHTIEPWNHHTGADLPILSKKAIRKGFGKLVAEFLWVLLGLSIFCFLASWLIW